MRELHQPSFGNPFSWVIESPAWKASLIESRVWLWIVCSIHKCKEPAYLPNGAAICEGEAFASLSRISDDIKWTDESGNLHVPSKSSVRRALHSIRDKRLIDVVPTANGTYIRFCEFDKYFTEGWR